MARISIQTVLFSDPSITYLFIALCLSSSMVSANLYRLNFAEVCIITISSGLTENRLNTTFETVLFL